MNVKKIANQILNENLKIAAISQDEFYNAINTEVGSSSSRNMAEKISQLNQSNKSKFLKEVEEIVSSNWGPNITQNIVKNIAALLEGKIRVKIDTRDFMTFEYILKRLTKLDNKNLDKYKPVFQKALEVVEKKLTN